MIKIIIASHGTLAEGVLNTIKLITGQSKNIYSITMKEGETPDQIVQSFLNIYDNDNTFVVCTDLAGGSVNSALMQFLDNENIHIITGFNLPLILQLVLNDKINVNDLKDIINESKEGIKLIENIYGNEVIDDFWEEIE